MHFKYKVVGNKKYRYAVRSLRLPGGRVVPLEKLYQQESPAALEKIFGVQEIHENFKYVLKQFGTTSIFTDKALQEMEAMKVNFKLILKKLTPASREDMLNRFTANFTYESNALEGNSLTLKDVSMALFENISLEGKDLREIYEARNSRTVVEFIMKNKFSIAEKDILQMHRMLVKDTGITAGYKRFPNVILGRQIETIPPEKVPSAMKALVRWYSQHRKEMHPVRLAALFHGKFEQIHPFEDGNGRVGRFLINVILVKNKYPPLIIRKSQRVSYLKALASFDSNYSGTLERFVLEKFKETYQKFFEVYVKYTNGHN